MDMQRILDAMMEQSRITRSDYHLTLGQAIKEIAALPYHEMITFDFNGEYPTEPSSYRGYYSDLAFGWGGAAMDTEGFAVMCNSALGETYTGYKGGDFLMGLDTPLWAAQWGNTGRAIIGLVRIAGTVKLLTKEVE